MKRVLCRRLEKGKIRRSQKYNNTIGVIQEIAFMAELLKRSQAVHAFPRLCDKKDLKQLFTQRGREGKPLRLQMLESATASRGGRKM